jgi:hypothetical protein
MGQLQNNPQNSNKSFILDIVPPLPFEQTVELERDTSAYLQDRGLRAGPCSREQLTDALKERVRFLTEASFSLAARCEPVSLLRALVAANEGVRACLSSLTWAATDRPDVSRSTKQWARAEMPVLTPLSVSLRLVVEMISARPPQGNAEASPELLTALWGHADEVLRLGIASDLIHNELLPSELSMERGLLELPRLADAPQHEDRAIRVLREMPNPLATLFDHPGKAFELTAAETAEERDLFNSLAAATAQVGGVDLFAGAVIVGRLSELAGLRSANHPDGYNPGGIYQTSEDELVSKLSTRLNQEPARVRKFIRFLCLEPNPDYPGKPDMPWVYQRRRSYQARPLVRAPAERDLIWSGFHTYAAMDVILGQLGHANLPGVDSNSDLGHAMAAFSEWGGKVFEAKVLDVARSNPRLKARKIDKLNGRRLARANGNRLGDIDVLVAEPESRTLLNIDAKSGSAARTPREAYGELARFRVSGKGKTDADHLLERAKLVEEALPDALEQLGVESSADGWRVRSAIVLKSPPVASLLDPAALPILGFVELAQLDLQKWMAQLP